MTLREELKPREEPTMSRIDHDLHDEIAKQVAEFVNRGGKVNVIPTGVGIDNIAKLEVRNEFDNTKSGEYTERRKKARLGAEAMKKEPTPIEYCGAKNRSKFKNKSGNQNIRESSGFFYVTIGSIPYGKFLTRQEAIEYRDQMRIKLNLPPADY